MNTNGEKTGIEQLLDLIDTCTKTIEMRKTAGESENSLGIRQDKHLRQRLINDLNKILSKKRLKVELTE